MTTIKGRLDSLERAVPPAGRDDGRATWGDLSTPALFWVVRFLAQDRAERRRFGAAGDPASARVAFLRLPVAERQRAEEREVEALLALQREHGPDAGLRRWVEEAPALGAWFAGETGESHWRGSFVLAYDSFRGSLARPRADHATWAAATGWRPGMSREEEMIFEWPLFAAALAARRS